FCARSTPDIRCRLRITAIRRESSRNLRRRQSRSRSSRESFAYAGGERKKCKGGAALKLGKKSFQNPSYARFRRPAEGRGLIWSEEKLHAACDELSTTCVARRKWRASCDRRASPRTPHQVVLQVVLRDPQ